MTDAIDATNCDLIQLGTGVRATIEKMIKVNNSSQIRHASNANVTELILTKGWYDDLTIT